MDSLQAGQNVLKQANVPGDCSWPKSTIWVRVLSDDCTGSPSLLNMRRDRCIIMHSPYMGHNMAQAGDQAARLAADFPACWLSRCP